MQLELKNDFADLLHCSEKSVSWPHEKCSIDVTMFQSHTVLRKASCSAFLPVCHWMNEKDVQNSVVAGSKPSIKCWGIQTTTSAIIDLVIARLHDCIFTVSYSIAI